MYVHTHVYIWKGWRCASVSYMNVPVGVVFGMITLLGLALSAHILRCKEGWTRRPSDRASIRMTITSIVKIDWYIVRGDLFLYALITASESIWLIYTDRQITKLHCFQLSSFPQRCRKKNFKKKQQPHGHSKLRNKTMCFDRRVVEIMSSLPQCQWVCLHLNIHIHYCSSN